jgi:hypothetical protein
MSSQMTLDLNNINMCGEDNIVFLYVEEKVEIYKKSKGWDNTPLWLKFGRKDGIFQWLKSDIDPGYVASSMGLISRAPIFQKEDTLYWNFILRDSDPSEEQPLCEKIDVKFFSGEDSVFTCFQLNVSWDGDNFRYGCTDDCSPEEFTYEFYSNAFPLIELPNSAVVQGPVEGWTCLESSQEEKVYSESEAEIECLKAENESLKDSISNLCEVHQKEIDLINSKNEKSEDDTGGDEEEKRMMVASVNALIEENTNLKEELEAKNLLIQQLTEDTSSDSDCSEESDDSDDTQDYDSYAEEIYQERRIDPFDNEMYTKEEFQDYYGYDGFGDAMWEMNHPDKVSKVLMYEWILSRNEDVLNTKSKNYIMDKMIETLCS